MLLLLWLPNSDSGGGLAPLSFSFSFSLTISISFHFIWGLGWTTPFLFSFDSCS